MSFRVVMISEHTEHGAVHPAAEQPVRARDAEDVHDLLKVSYQLFTVFSVTGFKFRRRFCKLREHEFLGWFGRKPVSESINKLVELFFSQ